MNEALNFENIEAAAEISASHSFSIWPPIAMILWALSIALSVWYSEKYWQPTDGDLNKAPIWLSFSSSLKLALTLTAFILFLAQLMGATTAYIQTQKVYDSIGQYFGYISTAKLLGISHSHLFGFAVTYGFFSVLLSFTCAPARIQRLVIATALWSSLFDIISWWGIRFINPAFHWLSMICGIGILTSGSTVLVYIVLTNKITFRAQNKTKDVQ